MDEWSARGDSNPDLHGLNVPRLPVAPRADNGGDHGRIRRTWPLVPPGGLEPPPRGLRARHAALTPRRVEADRIGSALVRPTGIEPVPPRWRRGMHLHTQAERGPVLLAGPSPFRRFSKNPLLRAGGRQGIRTQSPLRGERSYGPSTDHPLVPPVLATAPGLESRPTSSGRSDAPVRPHCPGRLTSRLS